MIKKNENELQYEDGTKILMICTKGKILRGPNANGIIIYFRNFDEQEPFCKTLFLSETHFFSEILQSLCNMRLNISIFILQEKQIILPPETSYTINTTEYK